MSTSGRAPRTSAFTAGLLVAVLALALSRTVAFAEPGQVPHALGRLQLTCTYSHSNNDDFLVHPLLVGGSHAHDYFGARAVDASTTPSTLQGRGTTCPNPADESAYWSPALSLGGKPLPPTAAHVYYERNTESPVEPFPAGFGMVAGDASGSTEDTKTPRVFFGCAHSSVARSTRVDFNECPSYGTDGGQDKRTFVIWVEFPNCWDGVPVTGRANMVYAAGRDARCPADHPRLLPTVRMALWYPVPTGASLTGLRLASGPMGSAHSDFVNGWTSEGMQKMIACLNDSRRSC